MTETILFGFVIYRIIDGKRHYYSKYHNVKIRWTTDLSRARYWTGINCLNKVFRKVAETLPDIKRGEISISFLDKEII